MSSEQLANLERLLGAILEVAGTITLLTLAAALIATAATSAYTESRKRIRKERYFR